MTTVDLAPLERGSVTRLRAPVDAPEVAAAQSHLGGADLLVDLDLVVLRAGRHARLRARHALCGSTVHALATAGSPETEVTTCDVALWPAELERACRVAVPDAAAPAPAADLTLPWDLLVGAGAALERHRQDLYGALVGRAAGTLTAGRRVLGRAAADEQVRRLHQGVVGRLRCVGTVPGSRRVGWVSWLLFSDGWHALTPYSATGADGPRAMVRVEHRAPRDLAHDVARWTMQVPR